MRKVSLALVVSLTSCLLLGCDRTPEQQVSSSAASVASVEELPVLAHNLVRTIDDVAASDALSMQAVVSSKRQFDQLWDSVSSESREAGSAPIEALGWSNANDVAENVRQIQENADDVVMGLEKSHGVRQGLSSIESRVAELRNAAQKSLQLLQQGSGNEAHIEMFEEQLMLLERMSQNARDMLSGADGDVIAIDTLGRSYAKYERLLHALKSGDQALKLTNASEKKIQAHLAESFEVAEHLGMSVDLVMDGSPVIFQQRSTQKQLAASVAQLERTIKLALMKERAEISMDTN